MTTVLLAHGNPAVQRLQPFLGKGVRVVALDIATSAALTKAGIAHKTADAYALPDSNKRTVDFLNAWSSKPLLNNKTIKDVLTHDGFSFWWCMEQWLYYSFLYRDPLNKVIEAIDAVMTVLDAENPANIVFVDDGALVSKIIRLVADKNQIAAAPIACPRTAKERVTALIRPWGIREFFRWHIRARKFLWKFERVRARYKPPQPKGKHILAVCAYHWRTVEHPSLSAPVLGDPYITPIAQQLRGNAVTYVDATQREYVGFSALKNKARSAQRHVLLEQYASVKTVLGVRRALKQLQRAARELERSPAFQKSWTLDGIDLWPVIAPQFRCYFTRRLEGHLMDYASVKALLAHERPDAVMYPCEGGDLAYVFYALCKREGIPCVGVQHGTMSYSPLTAHHPDEMCADKPSCLPRPTKLLLYGSYYRDFLVMNGSYPPKELEVIGNLRFDHFVNARKLAKKDMAAKYGLEANKPVVMYLTQILPSPQESEQITREVFRAVKELGLPLIVKQHPGEPSDALYHALAKEYGLQPLITKTASTLELLTASDVLIGAESTLDYEAMMLDKPVIVVNFGGRPDTLPFVTEGAALGVTKPEDTLPALQKALFDEPTRKAQAERMRALIEKHCYKIDGKAAERAAGVVRELIK